MTSVNDFEKVFFEEAIAEQGNGLGLGRIPSKRRLLLLGNNPVIDTATVPEDLWFAGGLYNFITSPVNLEIVSTSASDNAAANVVVVLNLLDANYDEQTVMLVPNGTTAVPVPGGPWAALNSMVLLGTATGSVRTNVGDIAARDAGGGAIRAEMPAGYGQSRKAIYTVPRGYTLNMNKLFASINRSQGATPSFATMNLGVISSTNVIRLPFEWGVSSTAPSLIDINPGAILSEKETFVARCVYVSNNGTNLTVACSGILNKN